MAEESQWRGKHGKTYPAVPSYQPGTGEYSVSSSSAVEEVSTASPFRPILASGEASSSTSPEIRADASLELEQLLEERRALAEKKGTSHRDPRQPLHRGTLAPLA